MPNTDLTDDVVEIAIRRLKENQDITAFEKARDAFVSKLKAQQGVGTDREFKGVFDYKVQGPPNPPVYIGMTQYHALTSFDAAGKALGTSAEAGAFFATFQPEVFTAMRPLKTGTKVDIASIANQPNQVLEIAVRDCSLYTNFQKADYEAKRDAFLKLLSQQKGFVAEYQWVSALDANLAIGMTVYESQEAFQTIAANKAFAEAPEMVFLANYPPKTGYINISLK